MYWVCINHDKSDVYISLEESEYTIAGYEKYSDADDHGIELAAEWEFEFIGLDCEDLETTDWLLEVCL